MESTDGVSGLIFILIIYRRINFLPRRGQVRLPSVSPVQGDRWRLRVICNTQINCEVMDSTWLHYSNHDAVGSVRLDTETA